MMHSKITPATRASVWIWLPNETSPVVAGLIEKQKNSHVFTYGRSYRERENAISLSPFELPLKSGTFEPTGINTIHSCLRDAAPDAWGRRVIYQEFSHFHPDELDFMLLSGSNRIGALDFQESNSEYIPRLANTVNLSDIMCAAELVEKGSPLPHHLGLALLRGTSIGGARPKCLLEDKSKHLIAKFPLHSDIYDIIKAEYIAMKLAGLVSINVAKVNMLSVMKKEILLIERFDRSSVMKGTARHLLLSGLSLLGLNELEARYASYCDLADIIRQRFYDPKQDLIELYKRLVFNILIGNTDDHARNHSAFWDGEHLRLTPAYDLCPQPRAGQEATQAMAIEGLQGNLSTLINVLSVSEKFLLSKKEAKDLINEQISIIQDNWIRVCDEASLPIVERQKLWEYSVFNPFCFYGWEK